MRRRIALIAAWLGGALAITALAIFGIGALDAARLTSATPGDLVESPLPPSPMSEPTETATAEPTPTPVPIETAAAQPVDEFGTPVYGLYTDPTSITYPTDMVAEERANAEIWVQQQFIVAQCMDDKGFDYTWKNWWELSPDPENSGAQMTGSPADPSEFLALFGDTGGGIDYRWEDAGCHGYAVHVTGQDNAN